MFKLLLHKFTFILNKIMYIILIYRNKINNFKLLQCILCKQNILLKKISSNYKYESTFIENIH